MRCVSHDRTMQDIVYKVVPHLQQSQSLDYCLFTAIYCY